MAQATIHISEDLKEKIESYADNKGLSVEAFLRESMEARKWDDSFFTDDAVFMEEVPSDSALNHDKYLYK